MPKKGDKGGKKGAAASKKGGRKSVKKNSIVALAKKNKPPPPPPPPPIVCRSNQYPGLLKEPNRVEVVIARSRTYNDLYQLLDHNGLANRLLIVMPWGKYAVFREFNGDSKIYYLNDACACTANVVNYYDLFKGTAGFICFAKIHYLVEYILNDRFKREKFSLLPKTGEIERVCTNFCTNGGANIFKVCNKRGEVLDIDDFIIKNLMFPRGRPQCRI